MPMSRRWAATSLSLQLVELAALLAVADQLAVDGQPAGVDLLQVVDAPQERGLAGAGRADQADDLARGDLQVDALEHLERAEGLVDAFGLHHGHRRAGGLPPRSMRCPPRCAPRARSAAARVSRAAEAAAEALLQVVLADHEQARQGQVPEDRRDGHRDDLERPAADGPQLEAAPRSPGRRDSEVSFSMVMVSLPVGGTITRIACGSTMRRSVLPRLMPSAWRPRSGPRRPTGCRRARSPPCRRPRRGQAEQARR